jgi:hypothetical protein
LGQSLTTAILALAAFLAKLARRLMRALFRLAGANRTVPNKAKAARPFAVIQTYEKKRPDL